MTLLFRIKEWKSRGPLCSLAVASMPEPPSLLFIFASKIELVHFPLQSMILATNSQRNHFPLGFPL